MTDVAVPEHRSSPVLSALKVVSITHFLQGPSACQLLGDLGADVIRVEPPTGAFERHWAGPGAFMNGESVFFLLAGRNQRSLAVDLRSSEGKEVLGRLVEQADVLVESLRPGALEKLGFGYEDVRERNPQLIYASLSGYGQDGPYRRRAGQDVLLQAMSGLASVTGADDQPPTPVGASIVDQHAAVLAAFAILAATCRREETGVGAHVDVNLLGSALDLQIEPLSYFLNGWRDYPRSRTGVSSPYYKAPYGVFPTADGHLCVSISPPSKLAAVLDDPWFEDVEEHEEFARREEIQVRVAGHMRAATNVEWSERFERADMWFAPVNGYADVEEDPQVRHNGVISSYEHPRAGTVRALAHPIRYDGRQPAMRRLPPALGADTADVLAELGFTDAETADLDARGIVRTTHGGDPDA